MITDPLPPGVPQEAQDTAIAHAISEWPKENCGVLRDGVYEPALNRAADPLNDFLMAPESIIGASAVFHSHNGLIHEPWPTKMDMQRQTLSALPWCIITTDGEDVGRVLWWGNHVLDEPLLDRPFESGARDCYALVRAWFRQNRSITLPDIARSFDWWLREDLAKTLIGQRGFRLVAKEDRHPGDVLLMKINAEVTNHCAVLLEGGLMVHHMGGRLSREEPVHPWLKFVTGVLRHD